MIPALLFLGHFALYLYTLHGTIPPYRDSGDLIATVSVLGIAHPPGYPFYVLLGKVFIELVPWGNIAYRVNVFSAVAMAGAVAMLYQLLIQIASLTVTSPSLLERRGRTKVGHVLLSLITAAVFGCTPAVVALAQVAEMYALAILMAALVIFCFLRTQPRWVYTGILLWGLSFGVHPTLIVLMPYGLWAIWRSVKASRISMGRYVMHALGCFGVGLSIFIFLPIRAVQDPPQNWGNPSTWRYFWRMVTRADYGGLKLHPVESEWSWTGKGILDQCVYFGKSLMEQWSLIGLLLGIVGITCWIFFARPRQEISRDPESRNLWKIWITVFLFAGPLFFLLANLPLQAETTSSILEPYLVLVNFLWAFVVAQGLAWMWNLSRPIISFPITIVLAGFLLWKPIKEEHSHRQEFFTYDYGRNLLRSLPTGSVLYEPDDPTAFTLRALQITEKRREDVVLLNFFRTRWGYEQLCRRHPELVPGFPISSSPELQRYFWTVTIRSHPFYGELPQKFPEGLSYAAEGLVYRAIPPAGTALESLSRAEALFQIYPLRGAFHTVDHPDFFTSHLLGYYAAAHSNVGLKYTEVGRHGEARRHYYQALVIDPRLAAAYNNLGILEFTSGHFEKAKQYYQQALRIRPDDAQLQHNLELAQQKLHP